MAKRRARSKFVMHPAVQSVLEEVRRCGLSDRGVARMAGMTGRGVGHWRQGQFPILSKLTAVARVVGLEIIVRKRTRKVRR